MTYKYYNTNHGFYGRNYLTMYNSGRQSSRQFNFDSRNSESPLRQVSFDFYYSGVDLTNNSFIETLSSVMSRSTTYADIYDSYNSGNVIGRVATTNSRVLNPDGNVGNSVIATYYFTSNTANTAVGDKLVAHFTYTTNSGGLVTSEPLITYTVASHGTFSEKVVKMTVIPIVDSNKTRLCRVEYFV